MIAVVDTIAKRKMFCNLGHSLMSESKFACTVENELTLYSQSPMTRRGFNISVEVLHTEWIQ